MAIYHLSVQVISRGQGRSCVAAAAYRSGEKLEDARQGLTHDYSRRHDVRETWIQAPEDGPAWVQDRQSLWTAIDAAEKRKDAQTAREVNVALPRELTPEQQREAVQEFVQAAFISRGMVADVAIHEGHNDQEPNPHAHILLTTRGITPEGFGPKNRDWNTKELLVTWRMQWEITCNEALEDARQTARIDARSLAAQKIDRLPTVHEGPAVRQMEARGIPTERGSMNRVIRARQSVVVELEAVRQERQALEQHRAKAETSGSRYVQLVQQAGDPPWLTQQRQAAVQAQTQPEPVRRKGPRRQVPRQPVASQEPRPAHKTLLGEILKAAHARSPQGSVKQQWEQEQEELERERKPQR